MSASPERERRSLEVSSDFVPSAFARWGVRASARGGSGGGQAADLVLEGELALLYDHQCHKLWQKPQVYTIYINTYYIFTILLSSH